MSHMNMRIRTYQSTEMPLEKEHLVALIDFQTQQSLQPIINLADIRALCYLVPRECRKEPREA